MHKSARSIVFKALATVFLIAPLASAGCLSAPPDADSGSETDTGALSKQRRGEGTFYAKTSDGGNCSFGHVASTLFGAMNQTDYQNSAACGACAQVSGPKGSVKIQIVDRCPECKPGDIDLSEDAFSGIADMSQGRVPISWHYIPCQVEGPVVYRFKEGSSQWWAGVQVKNTTYAVSKFEYLKDGQWQEGRRETFNYFIIDSGLGQPPYSFRVTDAAGDVIEDHDIPLLESGDTPGKSQFPVRN